MFVDAIDSENPSFLFKVSTIDIDRSLCPSLTMRASR